MKGEANRRGKVRQSMAHKSLIGGGSEGHKGDNPPPLPHPGPGGGVGRTIDKCIIVGQVLSVTS